MSRIHRVKLKGFFFLPLKWFWDFFSCSFWFLKSANYPLQSLFQTRPQTGGDSRCVFEESENMILQVSTLNFFLMMLFASRGFPAPSASQWKKRGKCLWRNVFTPGERRKKTFTDRSYSLFPLLNAKKTFCSAAACCCLGFWSGSAALNCPAVPGARQQLSIAGLHLGHVSKGFVISGRQTSDTTRQTPEN